MRVPSDLVKRYGQQFVRVSLKTSDDREAMRKTEILAKKYLAQFKALKTNELLTPVEVTASATEIAQSYGALDVFLEHVVEPKRQRHAALDEERYLDDPEAYLSPKDLQVVKVLQQGVETARLSTAIDLYWKTHKKSGDADFVEGVERDWNRFMALVGDVPVMSPTRAQARSFVEQLASDGLKTTSMRRKLNHVTAALSAAIREADLTRPNPFARLQISGEGQDAKAASVPTRATLENIAKTLKDDPSATALLTLMMLEAGNRIAEFSGLKVSDVFLDAAVPHVRIKPNDWRGVKTISSIREFPLVGVTLEAIKKAMALPRSNDALFPQYAKKNGNTNASAAVNKRLKRWDITSKSFRHSRKDRLREVGCPKDIRDAIQGYENGEIAETYGLGHTLPTMQGWLEKAKVTTAS